MIRCLLLWLCIISYTILGAQSIPLNAEQQLEALAETLGEELDDSYLQQLYYLQKNPIVLNKATEEELQQLRWLTELQIQSFIQYRRLLGPLKTIYELQAIPAWDLHTIKKTLAFITTDEPIILAQALATRLKQGQHTLFMRTSRILEKQKGYNKELSNHYAGNPDRLLLRYRYQYKNLLQYGITAEKDPGEAFFKGAQSQGFDFYSFHLFARQLGYIKALAVGDFVINMGQGLVQWQSMGFKKNAEVVQVKRQSATLLPYTATTEYNYNRGIGITWSKGFLEGTAFASWRKMSGTGTIDTSVNEEVLTSFYNAGLHRTAAERLKRNAIGYLSAGGIVTYKWQALKVGVNTVVHRFSHALQKSHNPYDLYGIEGKKWSNYSLDYSWTYKNIHMFGELAADSKLNKAFLSGAMVSLDAKVDASIIYRNIGQGYQTLWGSAFTENTLPVNEKGLYTGVSVRPAYKWRIDAFVDLYQFPWLKYSTAAPAKGKDFLIQATHQPNKLVEVYVRYKIENKEKNTSADTNVNFLTTLPKQSLRFHLNYKLDTAFTLKSRTELIRYSEGEKGKEEGFLFYLQGDYVWNTKWKGNMRIQYFETSGFNSRVYAYESDVLYGYSIPAFFDKGIRYYINVNYEVAKNISLWARWAQIIYSDKKSLGSGLDIINGNVRSEYKVQCRILF
jgi:hypothetical protein